MFGLSLGHMILFGVIALIFVGPEQLPEVARTIGRILNELRRATSDFQSQFGLRDERPKWHEPQPLPKIEPPPPVADEDGKKS